ncbi:uncharacterized protein ASPGLDRAFT_126979 [Aspergillus glaucus CBS 516.65]|uniref:Zn(2)-C6 fungal-type domain-containing protein n=1 Tax=Aspergillus glaucus CBS 516.65 TaxID=1160497 RepID=A0A1L9VJ66_ASPGL|nr:hypothetical protein ASPGLDRAFT_126979 [Aspergillus glaucus CBS 516.65]OJJ83968.1 hypothetical protein ASPGLDRAFT_126979 [Aspergillus glaucus CBS 516.65]
MPRNSYNRFETPTFHPFPSGLSFPSNDIPPPPPAHTISSRPQPPPFGVAPLDPHPNPHPKPARVAIPRKTGGDSGTYRRHRSARACEPCRNRKIKCDGNKPMCRQCVEQKITCTFLDVKRVREQKQLGTLGMKVEKYEELLRDLEPDVDIMAAKRIRRALKVCLPLPLYEGSDTASETSSLGSLDAIDLVEEDLNRNEKTRATGYFGKNSEVAWMQKLENEAKYRSRRGIQDSDPASQCSEGRPDVPISLMSYYLDDLDIPMFHEVDPSAVPSKQLADKYFSAYMLVFHPSFNVVRRKTFTSQYARFIREPNNVRPPRKWLAVLNMIFAIGCHYCRLTGDDVGGDRDSLIFLARARKLSLTEDMLFEHSDLQQVQVEFLVAFYMLARGQVNRASKFANMAFRSALSLGINLRFVDDRTDHGAKEARSRLWWSIYILEHSIAGLTGRVSCASEGLSSVPLPVPYEEEYFDRPDVLKLFQEIPLRQKYLKPTLFQSDEESRAHGEWLEKCGPSPSSFFFCSVDLVFITQAIINKVYSIEGIRERSGQIEQRIRKYGIKLDNWLFKVPSMYQFTTTGGREALNGDINLSFAREKFSLAMHFYSSKITLCRPCLTHANARNITPSTDIGPSQTANGDDNDTTNPKDTDIDSDGDTSDATNPRRARFRTEMALSCLRASCALLSLLPNEPDILSLNHLAPWWHHLHYIMQATTALLLGLGSWPTSPPAEEKYSTSVQAPIFGTSKALRWLYHMSVHGDPAARRAFILSDSFMRRIAPNLGIDVSDLPEVETLPVTGSLTEGMPVPASGVGSGVEGVSGDSEEAGEREREIEVEGRGMEGAAAKGEVNQEWDGVGGRIAGVYGL